MAQAFDPTTLQVIPSPLSGKPLIDITLLLQQYNKSTRPSDYKTKKFSDMEEHIDFQHKFVSVSWAVNFLRNQDDFIMWVITIFSSILEQQIQHQPTVSNLNQQIKNDKQINISETFGYCCTNCNHHSIDITKVTPRKKKQKWDIESSQYRKKQVKSLMNVVLVLFENIKENFIKILALHFQQNLEAFKQLIYYVCTKPTTEDTQQQSIIIKLKRFFATMSEELDLRASREELVYLKDFLFLSDTKYASIRDFIGLQALLPCENTIYNGRTATNTEIIEEYKVEKIKNTDGSEEIYGNIIPMLKDLITIQIAESVASGYRLLIEKGCDLKLTLDGGARTFVCMVVSMLNGILSSQSRDAHLLLGITDQKETSKTLEIMCSKVIPQLNELTIKGLEYKLEDKIIQIQCRFFSVQDLGALAKMTDLLKDGCFCPFCMCKAKVRHLFDQLIGTHTSWRNLKYNIPMPNVTTLICSLHMKLRIVTSLIIQILKRVNNPEIWHLMEERMNSLPFCSQFKYRNESFDDIDQVDQNFPKMPYLNGAQASIILLNAETVFNGILDNMEKLIWRITKILIFNYVEGIDKEFQGNQSAQESCRFLCKCLGKLLNKRYPASQFGHYIHILVVHLPDLLFEFGCLAKYQNEGSEHCHSLHILALEQSTSAGKKFSEMKQIFLQTARKFYLAARKRLPWLGKLIIDNSRKNHNLKQDKKAQQDEENEIIKQFEQLISEYGEDNWLNSFEDVSELCTQSSQNQQDIDEDIWTTLFNEFC